MGELVGKTQPHKKNIEPQADQQNRKMSRNKSLGTHIHTPKLKNGRKAKKV